jgi:hypothetical protein
MPSRLRMGNLGSDAARPKESGPGSTRSGTAGISRRGLKFPNEGKGVLKPIIANSGSHLQMYLNRFRLCPKPEREKYWFSLRLCACCSISFRQVR